MNKLLAMIFAAALLVSIAVSAADPQSQGDFRHHCDH